MFAAVDLGSNSFRLHIGEYDGTSMRIIKTARDPIRLAAGLDSQGFLTEEAMQMALKCLNEFRKLLDDFSLDAVRVVATNTLRIACNAQDFLPHAEKAIGYPIEIISGEEEGRLIYMGVASALSLPEEKRLVVDIGGGSSEIILGYGHEIQQVESFSIGTQQQNKSFFQEGRIDAASFNSAIMSSRSYFEDTAPQFSSQFWDCAYGSSGTIRTISAVLTKNNVGDGTLSYKNLLALKARLIEAGHVNSIDLFGVKPERLIVMISGITILVGIMEEFGITTLTAINAGLRMGVLWDLQQRAMKRDRREQSIHMFMQRFNVNQDRALRVASISANLYTQLKPSSNTLNKYLYWSSLLHEVGLSISHTGAHKHSSYIIENADLSGFTTREQNVMSTLIVGQKGNLRKISKALSDLDFAKAVLSLRLATTFMHSKIDADLNDLQLKMKNRIELEIKQDWLTLHPTVSYWLEKERNCWNEIGTTMSIKIT